MDAWTPDDACRDPLTMIVLPRAVSTDLEPVASALDTAGSLWRRGRMRAALFWLRRAVQEAAAVDDDDRVLELARVAAEAADSLETHDDSIVISVPPPARKSEVRALGSYGYDTPTVLRAAEVLDIPPSVHTPVAAEADLYDDIPTPRKTMIVPRAAFSSMAEEVRDDLAGLRVEPTRTEDSAMTHLQLDLESLAMPKPVGFAEPSTKPVVDAGARLSAARARGAGLDRGQPPQRRMVRVQRIATPRG